MKKVIAVLGLALSSFACIAGGAESVAQEMLRYQDKADAHGFWRIVADESKVKLAAQLARVRANPSLRKLLVESFKIPPQKLESLTTEDYFVAILRADKTFGVVKTQILQVEEFGDEAVLHYRRGDATGSSRMVQKNGFWYSIADVE